MDNVTDIGAVRFVNDALKQADRAILEADFLLDVEDSTPACAYMKEARAILDMVDLLVARVGMKKQAREVEILRSRLRSLQLSLELTLGGTLG